MTAITLSACRCRRCGFTFTSGAAAPYCVKCQSSDIERTGTAATLDVPAPVPAGTFEDAELTAAQIRAQAQVAPTMLSYVCPQCGWSVQWPAIGTAPDSITAHEKTHPAE